MHFKALAILAAVGSAVAQRPTNTSICDYYTTLLLKENTAANQKTLLTLVVNTAVIGNYTLPNVGIAVPGILAKGEYNGTEVNLAPYFSGGLKSTNQGGTPAAVNFLDGGGAAPLKKNMPAEDETSNQYRLLTHLYSYFGALLGCSLEGEKDFPAYNGVPSQGSVHRFMNLDPHQIGYFITQVGLSAASFGVAMEDVTIVGTSLGTVFGFKCSPPTKVIPSQDAELQSICQNPACPLDPKGDQNVCASYKSGAQPAVANGTNTSPSGTTSPSPTSSGAVATASKAAAAHIVGQAGAAVGAALLALAL